MRRWFALGFATVVVVLCVTLGTLGSTDTPIATATGLTTPGTLLWGYEAAAGSARIIEYDIGAGTAIASCVPSPSNNGRGIAMDPIDGRLWYTFVDSAFNGDGVIHKATTSCASAGSLTLGGGSGGPQHDIGALSIDPDDNNIWAAGYQPIGGLSFLYKVDRTSGAILQSCSVSFGGGGAGNDTLAVTRLPGLPGSGKYILTDAGEGTTADGLLVIDASACNGGQQVTAVASYPNAVEITGIAIAGGQLFATDRFNIYALGGLSFSTVVASMSAGATALEGITLQTTVMTNTPTPTNSTTFTPTSTFTPTPTTTPVVRGLAKIPEGNANNIDSAIPAANLWLCIAPAACAGPGESDLRVVEHASNIVTGDQNGDSLPDGLGAYEFSVEYDNFVIQSVNPCDIVFGPTGAGSTRGPVDELDTSAVNPDCTPDPNGANNGICSMSAILENIIHFGCTTSGPLPPGPNGSFDLASLDLIPHPDLRNDIFPGNNNGVVTVIKDNGCELVDVFGHAVLGSVNGGLTPVCGDLAVTVRILEGDLNLDCKVDAQDQQLIAYRYGSYFGIDLYSKWFDLEPALRDLDIDIKDLQKVFGRDGSTCQDPIPAQPPLAPPAPFGG